MLIAGDLLLLLLDDESGKFVSSDSGVAVGGALLVELALAGSVEVREKTSKWSSAKVGVAGPLLEPAEPVLVQAVEVVAEKPRPAQELVTRLGKSLRDPVLEGLAAGGYIRRSDERALGFIPYTRWPAVSAEREAEVRRLVADVLVGGASPDERTAALIGLLSAVGKAGSTLGLKGKEKRAVDKRAKEIAEGEWAAEAVRNAVLAAQSAAAAAATAVVVAGAAGT